MGVSPARDHQPMTDDEVLDEARADGFELIERMSAGKWAVGWARGDDDRRPCFLEERQAIDWMQEAGRSATAICLRRKWRGRGPFPRPEWAPTRLWKKR